LRKKIRDQMTFEDYEFLKFGDFFKPDKELEKMSEALDANPQILDIVYQDIASEVKRSGKKGASAEHILRCAILYQMKGYDYRELARRVNSDYNYRKFTRFYARKAPDFSAIAKAVKMIRPETFDKINDILIQYSIKKKIEDGKALRSDGAVVQSDIHRPTDSALIWDSVRVLDRLMNLCKDEYPEMQFEYHDRTRCAKKYNYIIVMAKGKNSDKTRQKHYRKILKVADEVLSMALLCRMKLETVKSLAGLDFSLSFLKKELDRYISLARRVIDQCRRRVIDGEKIPASEKIVSIFEDHTDIICRGKTMSPAEYGHKIMVSTGKSGLVTQCKVCDGNPSDGSFVGEILDKHVEQFGKAPGSFAGDRRFYSRENEELAASEPYSVSRVSIPKPGYRSEERRRHEREKWFKMLQRFRAGIEGVLSTMLRAMGLTRCLWRGLESFKAYVGLSVFTYNLRKIASFL